MFDRATILYTVKITRLSYASPSTAACSVVIHGHDHVSTWCSPSAVPVLATLSDSCWFLSRCAFIAHLSSDDILRMCVCVTPMTYQNYPEYPELCTNRACVKGCKYVKKGEFPVDIPANLYRTLNLDKLHSNCSYKNVSLALSVCPWNELLLKTVTDRVTIIAPVSTFCVSISKHVRRALHTKGTTYQRACFCADNGISQTTHNLCG